MSGIFNIMGIWWHHYTPMALLTAFVLLPWTKNFFSEKGWRWLYIFFLSYGLSFCLTPIFRWLAYRFAVLDMPEARKLHSRATPLLGGAAVYLAFLIAILINGIYSLRLIAILAAATLLFAIGLLDDIREVSARVKLVIQIGCSVWVMAFGIILRVLPDTFGPAALIGNILLTTFWIVGITNAMNFFDGMDGMAAGLGVIISFFLGLVAFQTNQYFIGWIAVAMMGACIGFLPYNLLKRGKATIFLGDAGSTVMGFLLACVAVYGEWSATSPIVALASPLLIFWVLIFDMLHITVDRILSGRVMNFRQWIEYVGRDHLHHRLAYLFGTPKKSVLFIYVMAVCLGISALVLRNARTLDALLLLTQAAIIVVLITLLERRGRTLADANCGSDLPETHKILQENKAQSTEQHEP